MPFYDRALKSGLASGDAEPVVSSPAPGVVRVDARRAFAPLALETGLPLLAERARTQGIAALAIHDAFNVAPLWPEVEWLANQGLVALACTAAMPYVAPHGGRAPLFGTNPMAFGWPRVDGPPLVFDQASSASARGEIQLRAQDGEPLPEGWAIGPDGTPTTDPATALAGAQLPFGGAKGSSIALMIELLAGPLLGDLLSMEAGEADAGRSGAPRGGEWILAMDPARFAIHGDRARQLAHGEKLFAAILAQEGTRLPSDRRYAARRASTANGVEISAATHAAVLRVIAGD